MTNKDDERITNLEIQLAHQTATIDELNDVVADQWREIDQLKKYLKNMNNRIELIEESAPDSESDDQPPPHY